MRTAGDGVPICQEDLAGTLASFSWIVVDALRKLGVRVDDREAEDYHYRWRAIGEMLGVEPAAIPTDLAQAAELTELIAHRNHGRSEEGIEITRALFDLRIVEMAGRGSASFSIPVPPELIRIAQAQPA